MSTVVSLICLGPSFQKMTHLFLIHGSLPPTNLEKNLKPSGGMGPGTVSLPWKADCSLLVEPKVAGKTLFLVICVSVSLGFIYHFLSFSLIIFRPNKIISVVWVTDLKI